MRAATEGSLPPVMPQGNLVEVLAREVRQGSPGELMVDSTPSRQRRPPCKTNKEMSDEAADAAALTYLLTCPGPLGSCSPVCSPCVLSFGLRVGCCCAGRSCGALTRPSGRRLFVAGRGWVPPGRALVHPDGGCL